MKVRGTQNEVIPIEVNVDTVYVRQNIQRIEEDRFIGWEYDEEQLDKNEYIAKIAKDGYVLQDKSLVLNQEIEEIQQQNVTYMLAMTDMYEEQLISEQRHVETMMALTEIYEVVTGGN